MGSVVIIRLVQTKRKQISMDTKKEEKPCNFQVKVELKIEVRKMKEKTSTRKESLSFPCFLTVASFFVKLNFFL